jgi:hypothetical protein
MSRRGLLCFGLGSQRVEMVRPDLHHSSPLLEVLRAVVCSTNAIAFLVRKLTFNHIGWPSQFVELRRRGCPKPVGGHL